VSGCTIGVDLGGTKLLAGAVDSDGAVVASERRLIGGLSLDELLAATSEAVAALGVDADAVGFGIPSLIDRSSGISVRSVHLPLDGVPFGALMAERLGVPVVVDNDANCAVVAETRIGAARGRSWVVLLTLGTGIGGGLVLDGELYRGAVGAGGELGHVPVDLDGPSCFGGCPGRGCLEALCSGSAIARDAGMPSEEVTRLAFAGDVDALAVLRDVGVKLGAGLAGLAMTFNPEVIVIGGGVMAAGELLLAPAREELARRALAPSSSVDVVAAALGPEAGMIGAALLARDKVVAA
jgi:glucokinase